MTAHVPNAMLVTGGAGFIGSNFIRYQLRSDPDLAIVCLDQLTYAGSMDNLHSLSGAPRYLFVQGDVCDQDLVRRLLAEHDVDTVVHFAAETHVDRSITDPAAFVRTNTLGTASALEAARIVWLGGQAPEHERARRFHHVSTDEIYGALGPGAPASTEASPYAPNSPYAASKAGADHLVRAYRRTYGLPVVTTNSCNNYGPRQHPEKFVPTVIEACRRRLPVPVYGDGSNRRDWLHVDDHCRALDLVLRRAETGATYNIGAGQEHSNLELARRICAIFDRIRPQHAPHERLITFVPDRPGHDWRYAVDWSKLARDLDWRPQEDLATGLQKTVEWFLARPSGSRPLAGTARDAAARVRRPRPTA
jgi:dTDP-glucose 4,6-dehydratase